MQKLIFIEIERIIKKKKQAKGCIICFHIFNSVNGTALIIVINIIY